MSEDRVYAPGGDPRAGSPPAVFISHSHANRAVATRLQAVLERNDAFTFLDQDEIEAGETLPEEIADGLEACDTLLLLWSRESARSYWVGREWRAARELGKLVVPYLLDDTPLPNELDDLVYVEKRDMRLKHATLLRAIFGPDFRPRNKSELFPGVWKAAVVSGSMTVGEYRLTLRANGQIDGSGSFAGGFGDLVGGLGSSLGIGQIVSDMKITVGGAWTYDEAQGMLTLDVSFGVWGYSSQRGHVRIQTDGTEAGPIRGQEFNTGATWILQRV